MWPLAVLSLLGMTIVIERAIFWIRVSLGRDRQTLIGFLDLVDSGDYGGAAEAAQGSRDYVVQVLHSGLVHRNYSLDNALEMAAADRVQKMSRLLPVLDTIITMAPLLGILGTVLGIIQSFDLLGAAGVETPQAVTKGISQALITTAAGLTVALVVLVPFNYFQVRTERSVAELEQYTTSLQIVFQKHEREGRPGAPGAGASPEAAARGDAAGGEGEEGASP